MSSIIQSLITEIDRKLTAIGVTASYGLGADITIAATFIEKGWSTGQKKISFEASIFLDETKSTAFMWQLTKESGTGFSFGLQSESWSQSGKTLYRKVKAVQYGPEGKVFEYELDLGDITRAVKETAQSHGWSFKTVLKKSQASNTRNSNPNTSPPPFSQNPSPSFCPSCGKPVRGPFCYNCGRPTDPTTPETSPNSAPPGSSSDSHSAANTPPPFTHLLRTFPVLIRKFLFQKMLGVNAVRAVALTAFLIMVAFSSSCLIEPGSSSQTSVTQLRSGITGTINTASSVVAATTMVPAGGGTVAVSKAGDPLDGLILNVPPGAYGGNTNSTISYSPVTGHTFGSVLNPITPLITVDNGGAYANDIMEVTIPVSIPSDSFAMGFLYDAATGKLEGMPLIAETSTSITVGTRHFSSFLITMIAVNLLKNDVESGFLPGVDDFEFTNRGSYINPDGQCAGQSMAAMWYYCTRPDGASASLYGRYDNNGQNPETPDLWQDDSLAYRFANMVMDDIDQDAFAYQSQKLLRGVNDTLTWNAFAYAMKLTGEPQYVGLTSSKGGGHAMIVYGIKNSSLLIADPNYPGRTDRSIEFTAGKFTPYNSGTNAEEIAKGNGKAYESIGYMAKATLVDWGQIVQRWKELKAKTVGNDRFPAYQLVSPDEQGKIQPFTDGISVRQSKFAIASRFSDTTLYIVSIYRDGTQLVPDANMRIDLIPGNNHLGLYIDKYVDNQSKYVDFRYVDVVYGYLTISPPSQDGIPGQNLNYSLEVYPSLPGGYSLEWYADTTLVKKGTGLSCSVSFSDPGGHTVVAHLVDAAGKVVMEAKASATIKTVVSSTKPTTTTSTTKASSTNAVTSATTKLPTTAVDTFDYQAALAKWMADEAARFVTPEVTSAYTYTTKLEWVVTPYIKNGNVMGASRIISTKTFTDGQPTQTWVSSETFDAQNPGVYMTVAQLRTKYPQFQK